MFAGSWRVLSASSQCPDTNSRSRSAPANAAPAAAATPQAARGAQWSPLKSMTERSDDPERAIRLANSLNRADLRSAGHRARGRGFGQAVKKVRGLQLARGL
jgi:hypothetical protein